jgi:hypothetical protein
MNLAERSLFIEDWISGRIGLFVFVLLSGLLEDVNLQGWGIKLNINNSILAIFKMHKSFSIIFSLPLKD